VALHEATDALSWAMCPALYCRIRMAIEIASNLPAFFVIVDFIVGHNNNIKPSYRNVLRVLGNLFVCFLLPPMMMDAILATIVNGGRAIWLFNK
jgi:hypothetical protein